MIEYYTVHILVLIIIFFIGLVIGIFGFIPLKEDVYKISDYHYHPKNTFKIPIIWYKYTYTLHTNDDKMYDVSFYVNNTNDNTDIAIAIYDSINCARNKIIQDSIVHFLKPVYDTVLLHGIADSISNISYVSHDEIVNFDDE